MANQMLVDSNFLYALWDRGDKFHRRAVAFAAVNRSIQVIPMVALTEVTQLLNANVGQNATIAFLNSLSAPLIALEPVTPTDIQRVQEILETYADAELDFVDCCILAIAERLNITDICTFDRRDFTIFRPAHTDYLELLP